MLQALILDGTDQLENHMRHYRQLKEDQITRYTQPQGDWTKLQSWMHQIY